MDRRGFLKTMAGASLAATAGAVATGGAWAAPASARPPARPIVAPRSDPAAVARYRSLVPEIFRSAPRVPDHSSALVIGSGFGAAVAARRLAQAGVQVAVLERGSRWPRDPHRNIFPIDAFPDGRGIWRRTNFTGVTGLPSSFDYFGGVFDSTSYRNIDVWRGAAVGGGSIVFTGVLIEPEKRFFDTVFAGTGVDQRSMHARYYPRARSALRASPMPDDVYAHQAFTHSRIWDQQSRRAGYTPRRIDGIWDWSVVRDEMAGRSSPSAIIGCSNLGNSNGAKWDLNQNYLKYAEQTGRATIHPGHEVRSIGRDANKRYVVEVDVVAPTGEVITRRTVTTDRLFLGAGSIGTSELLVAAQATGRLPDLNEHIGQGWGTNGDAAAVRKLSLGGLSQGAPSASRILDESGMPVTLENWDVPGLPVDIGLIGSLGMALDDARGSFVYAKASGAVDLEWAGQPEATAAIRRVNNRVAAAAGVSVGAEPFGPDVNTSFTAHPLGGAVIGKASDAFGRVHGYDGLYVVDGAGIPGSTGTVNPSLTITALAERNLETIIAEGR